MKTKIIAMAMALFILTIALVSCGEKTPVGTPIDADADPIDTITLKRGINVSALERVEMKEWWANSVWGWVYKKSTYKNIKKAGFDHVRVPANFAAYYSDGEISEDFLEDIDNIIKMILEQDMCAVLDFHGWWGTINGDVEKYEEQFYDIWEQVAERYKDYPSELIFELLNEPYPDPGPDPLNAIRLNEIQLEVIKRIRVTNPKRIIVAATPEEWDGAFQINEVKLPEDDPNIIVSVHTYRPIEFTHQGLRDWEKDTPYNVPLVAGMEEAVDSTFKTIKHYMERTGRKVWVGEFGVYVDYATPEDVTKYLSYVVDKMEEAGIPWAYWEYNGGFGAYDKSKNKWKDYVLNSLIK